MGQVKRSCLLALLMASMTPALEAQSGSTVRVSALVECGAPEIGLGKATVPGISADGRFVVFRSNTSSFPGEAVLAWFPNLDGAGTFGPLQAIAAQLDVPTGLVVAALDGDDRPDIATSSQQNDLVAWYVNDLPFSGTFVGPQPVAESFEMTPTVSAADMDGDGDVDLLAASYGDSLNTTRWFANDGQGQFTSSTDISNYAYAANALFAADCDGDGDLDVLTSGSSPTVSWEENVDGLGSFTSEHILSDSADGPLAVRAADLDGDGDRDVVAASNLYPAGPQIRWYRNLDGQGQFQAESALSTVNDPWAIDTSDLDGDGDVDVLAVLSADELDNRVVWFPNDGLGHFGAEIVVGTQIATVRWVGAADLDGDGDSDYVIAASGQAQLAWFPNDGRGTFGTKQVVSGTVPMAWAARAADLDGDDDLDLLLARGTNHEVCYFINQDGQGHFGPKQVLTTAVNNAFSVDASDLDGDGDLDALVTSSSDKRIGWHANLGAGTFGPEQLVSVGVMNPQTAAGADMDMDGDADVVAFGQDVTAWFENVHGDGTAFVAHVIQSAGASDAAGQSAVPTDLDADGDLDVLVAGGIVGDFTWLENHGAGGFGKTHAIDQRTLGAARSVVGADLDGDADVDVLATFPEADSVSWYRNQDGRGDFGPPQDLTITADGARSVAAADMDGDGDLDVAAASWLDDSVQWFENLDGQGSFGAGQLVTTTADSVQQVACADVDHDGDIDVLSVSFDDDATTWHENLDGAGGAFEAHVIHDGPTVGARALATADLDSDGDLDVAMMGSFPSPVGGGGDVYRHDLALRETLWISKTLNGGEAFCVEAVISAGGRYVGFSGGGALDPDPALWGGGLFVNDTLTGVTTRVDLSSDGHPANNLTLQLSLSGDGRYAAFTSYANNLVPGDPTCCNTTDVFLRDRQLGTTIVLSKKPDGSWPTEGASEPVISADGRHVAFLSRAALVTEDTNGQDDVFDYDRVTGVLERVSVGSGGAQIEGHGSRSHSISGDGSIVAFVTEAVLDPLDVDSEPDVYVHNRRTLETSLVTGTNAAGAPVQDWAGQPRVSLDGRFVLFITSSPNLVPEATTSIFRAYRRDLLTGGLKLMSVGADGSLANKPVEEAVISGDGRFVAFSTLADNLAADDSDDLIDVFVHGVEPWTSLGCGDPGEAGTAALLGQGPLLPDTDATLSLSSAPPRSLAVLFLSLQSMPAAFKGGTLVALPPLLSHPIVIGPAGGFEHSFRWPAGFPAGTTVYFHLAVADPTASEGVALSNAIVALTP